MWCWLKGWCTDLFSDKIGFKLGRIIDWDWGFYLKWFQTVYWRLLPIVGKDWPSIDCIQPQWLLEWKSRRQDGKSMSSLVQDGKNDTTQIVSWCFGWFGSRWTGGLLVIWEKREGYYCRQGGRAVAGIMGKEGLGIDHSPQGGTTSSRHFSSTVRLTLLTFQKIRIPPFFRGKHLNTYLCYKIKLAILDQS